MTTLAERLKSEREKLGLTQSQLAKNAGIKNQSIIGMLESGQRKRSSHVPQIAAALGVSPLWLSTGKGSKGGLSPALYNISEIAMQIALAVNQLPESYQQNILNLVTFEGDRVSGNRLSDIDVPAARISHIAETTISKEKNNKSGNS